MRHAIRNQDMSRASAIGDLRGQRIARLLLAVSASILAFAHADSIAAVEGKLEINQACAAVGCFPGDVAGFPVAITAGGSYVLTSNLVTASTAIQIATSQATDIDLGGFTIQGPGVCNGAGGGVVCTGYSASGILASPTGDNLQVRIHDGSISGQLHGISIFAPVPVQGGVRISSLAIESSLYGVNSSLANGSAIEEIAIERSTIQRVEQDCVTAQSGISVDVRDSRMTDCAGSGVVSQGTLVVESSHLERIGATALYGGDGSVVRNVEIRSAGLVGVRCGRSCLVSRSVISSGAGAGILAGFVANIVDNVVDFNGGAAIRASDGSRIGGNSIGAATGGGSFPGIVCAVGCSVFDNVVRNSSQPLNLGVLSSYRRNVLSLYPGAAVTGSGVSGGDNLCEGTSC